MVMRVLGHGARLLANFEWPARARERWARGLFAMVVLLLVPLPAAGARAQDRKSVV